MPFCVKTWISCTFTALPAADIAIAIKGVQRADDDKLGEVLPRLHEEDPTFTASFDAELHQTIARGVGELPIVPPLATVANAVSNATGVRFTELPLSPPRILERLSSAS